MHTSSPHAVKPPAQKAGRRVIWVSHLDEWVSTPIYSGSDIPIHSVMVMQVDVIPSSPIYFSTRMEDGVVIADETLRRQIQEQFPESMNR